MNGRKLFSMMMPAMVLTALFTVNAHTSPARTLLYIPLSIAEKSILTGPLSFATNATDWLQSRLTDSGAFTVIPSNPVPLSPGEKIQDRDFRLGKTSGAGIVLSGYVDFYDGKLLVRVRLTDMTNPKRKYDDQVYTENLSNREGLLLAVSNLAMRVGQYGPGREPDPYIEPGNDSNGSVEAAGETNAPQQTEKTKVLRQLSLLSLGYQYPTGFELDFFEASYNWIHPDWRVGIGLGSCLVRMLLSFPGYTNSTGTILPVQLTVPLWTNPDKDRITDLIFRTEWAWYTPLSISGSSTNTNTSFFLDNPVNYLDFRLSFYFTRFCYVNAGCMWLYRITGSGSVYFYAGGTVFLGFYQKE